MCVAMVLTSSEGRKKERGGGNDEVRVNALHFLVFLKVMFCFVNNMKAQ